MFVKRTLGPKGQVVIPRDIREILGLREGSEVIFEVEGRSVTLKAAKDPDKAVSDYVSVVKRKLKREIDIDALLEGELLDKFDLRR